MYMCECRVHLVLPPHLVDDDAFSVGTLCRTREVYYIFLSHSLTAARAERAKSPRKVHAPYVSCRQASRRALSSLSLSLCSATDDSTERRHSRTHTQRGSEDMYIVYPLIPTIYANERERDDVGSLVYYTGRRL